MPGGKTRFCFCLNNYTEADVEWFHNTTLFKYVCFGKEIAPTTGTPHLQGYFEFENGHRKALLPVVKLLKDNGLPSRPNIQYAMGTAQQNITYCSKEGHFWENGDRPKGQGKRSDIDAAIELIQNGASLQDIAETCPKVMMMYPRGVRELMNFSQEKRTWKTEIYWLWGPSGSGKSQWAWTTYPEAYSKDPSTKWWCGLVDQDTAIIDDFRPSKEMPFNFILRLFDRYPMQLETKGGQVQCLLKRIIVTSPFSPDQMLSNLEWTGVEQGIQLKRRLDHVIQFPQIASLFLTSTS